MLPHFALISVCSGNVGKLQQLQLIWGANVCSPNIPAMTPVQQQQQLEDRDPSVQRTMAPDSETMTAATPEQPVVEEVPEGVVTGSAPAAAAPKPTPAVNKPAAATWMPNPSAPPKPAASVNPNPSAPPKPAATDNTAVISEVVTSDSDTGVALPVAVTKTPAETPVPSTPPPAAAAAGEPATSKPVAEVKTSPPASEMAKCSSLTCSQGTCPTASCALNGLGKDVVTMMCFGTNIVPAPMVDLNVQNACTNLACKLDRPNCTSPGVLGIGGFCTGRVVAMGTTAKLHPSGMAFLGYPCMESKGLITDMVPVIGDYTAKGTYVAKAWKVCDCINGFGLANNSVAFRTHKGGSVTFNVPKFPTLPHFPFINRALINMSMPDVLAQWVVANQNAAKVPHVSITKDESDELRTIIVDFNVPAVLVPKISMPLFKIPKAFNLPVYTIPIGNKTLSRVAKILPNMTSLPTIVMPKWKMPNLNLPKFELPEVSQLGSATIWCSSSVFVGYIRMRYT